MKGIEYWRKAKEMCADIAVYKKRSKEKKIWNAI